MENTSSIESSHLLSQDNNLIISQFVEFVAQQFNEAAGGFLIEEDFTIGVVHSDLTTTYNVIIDEQIVFSLISDIDILQNILIDENISTLIHVVKDSSANLIIDASLEIETVNTTDNIGGKALLETVDLLGQTISTTQEELIFNLNTLLSQNSSLSLDQRVLLNELLLLNSHTLLSVVEEIGVSNDDFISFAVSNNLLSTSFVEFLSTANLQSNFIDGYTATVQYLDSIGLTYNTDVLVQITSILENYISLEAEMDMSFISETTSASTYEENISLDVNTRIRFLAYKDTYKIIVGKYSIIVKNYIKKYKG